MNVCGSSKCEFLISKLFYIYKQTNKGDLVLRGFLSLESPGMGVDVFCNWLSV